MENEADFHPKAHPGGGPRATFHAYHGYGGRVRWAKRLCSSDASVKPRD